MKTFTPESGAEVFMIMEAGAVGCGGGSGSLTPP